MHVGTPMNTVPKSTSTQNSPRASETEDHHRCQSLGPREVRMPPRCRGEQIRYMVNNMYQAEAGGHRHSSSSSMIRVRVRPTHTPSTEAPGNPQGLRTLPQPPPLIVNTISIPLSQNITTYAQAALCSLGGARLP